MVLEARAIDLDDPSGLPDLPQLAREVRRTQQPVVLRENDQDVALITPAPRRRRPRKKVVTKADIDAALATFGTWADLDAEKLLRELDEARSVSSPPIRL